MLQADTPLLRHPTIIAAVVSFLTSIVVLYLRSWKQLQNRRKSLRRALKSEIKGTDWITEEDTYVRLEENIGKLEKPFGHTHIPTRIFDEGVATEIGILPEAEDIASYYTQARIMEDFIGQIQGTNPETTEQQRDLLADRQLHRFRDAHINALGAIEDAEEQTWKPSSKTIAGGVIFILGMGIAYVLPFTCN